MTADAQTLIGRSARLDLTGIDFAAFAEFPLDQDSLRCLRYMHDVEHHTMCYLRDLLATRAHREPEITDFLACWSFEEHWHGEALGQVLQAHGESAGQARVSEMRRRLPRTDSLRPFLFGAASALTRHLVAVHMAWGAVNELTTQAGYRRLAARTGHPVLTELLGRIMRQEGRHIDFYSGQAKARLSASHTARRTVRLALARLWAPVGSGVMPEGEVRFLSQYLFAGEDGLAEARRVDRAIDRLPGLEGLHLLEKAVLETRRAA